MARGWRRVESRDAENRKGHFAIMVEMPLSRVMHIHSTRRIVTCRCGHLIRHFAGVSLRAVSMDGKPMSFSVS
jgi:hypothetical protein